MWDMRAMYHWPSSLEVSSAYSDMFLLQGAAARYSHQQQQTKLHDKHLMDSLQALHATSQKELCTNDVRQKRLSTAMSADSELRTAISDRLHSAPSLPHRRPAPKFSAKTDLNTAEKVTPKTSQHSRVASFFISDILAATSNSDKMESDALTIVRPWDSTPGSTFTSQQRQSHHKRSAAAAQLSQEGPAAHRASGAAGRGETKVKGTSPLSALLQMTSKTFLDDSNTSNTAECGSVGQGGGRMGVLSGLNQSSKKKRKSRTAFTNAQIYELERRFLRQKYLTPNDRDDIARSLGLSNAQVITWFQNRRAKLKRDLEELKADMSAAALTGHPDMTPIFGSVEELQLYQHKHGFNKNPAQQRSNLKQTNSEGQPHDSTFPASPYSTSSHQSQYESEDDVHDENIILTSGDDSNGSELTRHELQADKEKQGPIDDV